MSQKETHLGQLETGESPSFWLPIENEWLTRNTIQEQFNQTKHTIHKWSFIWSSDQQNRLHHFLTQSVEIQIITKPFVEQIQKTSLGFEANRSDGKPSELTPDLTGETILTSGAVAFYGSILLSLAETKTVTNLEEIYHFTSLYMILDFFLDDPDVSQSKKTEIIDQLSKLINRSSLPKPSDLKFKSGIFTPLTYHLSQIIQSEPASHEYLKIAYQSEVSSALLQRNDNLTERTYLHLAEWKGGTTVQAIQSIIGVKPDQSGFLLGACIQLADDIHDIQEDQAEGINTIATHLYDTDGNLDKLLFYTVHLIEKLPPKYTLFRPILTSLLMHSLAILPVFSQETKMAFQKYAPFQETTNLRSDFYQILIQHFRGVHPPKSSENRKKTY